MLLAAHINLHTIESFIRHYVHLDNKSRSLQVNRVVFSRFENVLNKGDFILWSERV